MFHVRQKYILGLAQICFKYDTITFQVWHKYMKSLGSGIKRKHGNYKHSPLHLLPVLITSKLCLEHHCWKTKVGLFLCFLEIEMPLMVHCSSGNEASRAELNNLICTKPKKLCSSNFCGSYDVKKAALRFCDFYMTLCEVVWWKLSRSVTKILTLCRIHKIFF